MVVHEENTAIADTAVVNSQGLHEVALIALPVPSLLELGDGFISVSE